MAGYGNQYGPNSGVWNEAMDARIRELAEGCVRHSAAETAAAINSEFKTSFSRNATIGRARRLKPPVSFNSGSKSPTGMPKRVIRKPGTQIKDFKPALPNANVAKKIERAAASPFGRATALPPATPIQDYKSKELTFIQNEGCKWPTGFVDGEERFCGHEFFAPRKPYCRHHTKISPDKERNAKAARAKGVNNRRRYT